MTSRARMHHPEGDNAAKPLHWRYVDIGMYPAIAYGWRKTM